MKPTEPAALLEMRARPYPYRPARSTDSWRMLRTIPLALPAASAVKCRFMPSPVTAYHALGRRTCAAENKELNNGRLAMIAVAGMVAQELVDGKAVFG
jgi:hypothetical protein